MPTKMPSTSTESANSTTGAPSKTLKRPAPTEGSGIGKPTAIYSEIINTLRRRAAELGLLGAGVVVGVIGGAIGNAALNSAFERERSDTSTIVVDIDAGLPDAGSTKK